MMTESNCLALISRYQEYFERYISTPSAHNIRTVGVLADLTFSTGISLDQASAREGALVSDSWVAVQSTVPELPGSYTLSLSNDDGVQTIKRFAVPRRKNDLISLDSGVFLIMALSGDLATEVSQDLGIVPADGQSLKGLVRECLETYKFPVDRIVYEAFLAQSIDIYFVEPGNYTTADADSAISFMANGNVMHTVAIADPRQSFPGNSSLIVQGVGKGTFSGKVAFGCEPK